MGVIQQPQRPRNRRELASVLIDAFVSCITETFSEIPIVLFSGRFPLM